MKSLRRVSTSSSSSSSSSSSWNHLRSVLYVVASSPVSNRVHLKSPWFRRRRKHVLSPEKWNGLFFEDGRLKNEAKFVKIVRSGGVDPSIRAKVWPFLLGVYDINSSEEQRSLTQARNRREYEGLRKECLCLSNLNSDYKNRIDSVCCNNVKNGCLGAELNDDPDSLGSDCASKPLSTDGGDQEGQDLYSPTFDEVSPSNQLSEDDEEEKDDVSLEGSREETYSLGSRSSDSFSEERERNIPTISKVGLSTEDTVENFTTWRRIIRLDALRVNMEWETCLSSQTTVSEETACLLAESVGLKDYDNLDPSRIFHAARLVAILEAYAIYDPDIGYCQGMSDLLSPIVAVIEEDHEAFWCFVAFMKKARNNFMLDETGIRRQLNIVSKIIRSKDSHLYKHLAKLKAEDCCFVYRMVVVLFRRELSFEQTLCLWEVIWADQAAIRVGIGKSSWSRIRLQAPPTDDLLLYAIAACVLQRRKLIIERYNSMDEILKECNSMTGQLDVWKLLDDAHDLVVTLHDKV